MSTTYKRSGVDVEAGDALVDWLQSSDSSLKKSPRRNAVIDGIGGFAALYKASFNKMKNPLLVSCTDGVGTKVLIASKFKMFNGIGQDLVAMCVNDLICTGGEPLFFLDYYASGKLNLEDAKAFLTSVKKACIDSDCVLLGGETAEMPGMYKDNDFDCAGFAVGVVDASKRLGAHKVKAGDVVLGVESSGFHSNGYSLLRNVFSDDLDGWKNELLKPTALYVALARNLKKKLKKLRALAHITGGGMDNLPRVFPQGLGVELKKWPVPVPFLEVKSRTQMSWTEILSTLNCGVGLCVVVGQSESKKAQECIQASGFRSFELGKVQKSKKGWSLSAEWSSAE